MLLRELLYVDSDKVRGLLAQLDQGIVEGTSERSVKEKVSGAGLKGLAEHSQRWGDETTAQKSFGDALFPALEESLEALGLLTDISDQLREPSFWGESMQEQFPPGSLVRISAPASLFDARYVASTLTAFATTWRGLVNIESVQPFTVPKAPMKKGQQGSQVSRRVQVDGPGQDLEDGIPDAGIRYGGSTEADSLSREFMQGIIQIARGVFTPGLHVNMRPTGDATRTVTARLQEGRQFLEGEPDVLFARYGGGLQQWTLVGSVGHYGEVVDGDFTEGFQLVDGDSINRSVFAEMVNKVNRHLGTLGFVDLPQAPGFSVVPLAVYRVVGSSMSDTAEP